MFAAMFLLVPLAMAEPARCVASWTGSSPGCQLRGELRAEVTGPSENSARRSLLRELQRVAEFASTAQQAQIPTMTTADFNACPDTVATAFVNCFAEPALSQELLCFVEFADTTCWSGDILHLEEVGWRALDAGGRRMCAAVDERLVLQDYTDLELRRADCRARCEQRTTVRCANP